MKAIAQYEQRRTECARNPLSCLLLSLSLLAFSVEAQQTIFNVPTTDVLDKGKFYAELDIAFKHSNQEAQNRFSSFTPRVIVGLGSGIEAGLNVTGNIQPGADTTTIVPTVKWKFYENESKDVSLIAGTSFFIPVRNRAYAFGTYSYVAGSKTIGKTRLTAGAYVASKSVFAPSAVRGGGQFGIERTLNEKVKFAADWFTGRHSSGYFTPGIIYNPHPRVTSYWSYSIGNSNLVNGNRYFLVEVGYNF